MASQRGPVSPHDATAAGSLTHSAAAPTSAACSHVTTFGSDNYQDTELLAAAEDKVGRSDVEEVVARRVVATEERLRNE